MKILLLSVFTLFTTTIVKSQVEFGLFAGPQATSARYDIQGVKQKTSNKYGFQLGGIMKVPFENRLYFAPAIFYSMKGYKVTYSKFAYPPDPAASDNDVVLHNIETAALLQYDFSDKPGHLFIRFGPSIETQLFGKEKFNKITGEKVSRSMKFSFADYGRFGASLLGHFGYETSGGFTIFAQYTFGVGSVSNTDGGPSIRHRAAGISIGKYFNRKKIIIDTRNRE
jgi:hypothetical protein